MSGTKQILLVGSLPPTRSHAALLTHAFAMAAAESDMEVVCLIDALAPPPNEGLPYRVVRPFDSFIQSGTADNWARLFVVGSKGDSLPAIEALHAAPGAVIAATDSLFDLALPWLQTSPDFPANFSAWLTAKYGDAGTKVAEGFTQHHRMAKQLTNEVPAFDLLLSPATCHLALGQHQFAALKDAGFKPIDIGPPPLSQSGSQIVNSPACIALVGASDLVKTAVTDAQKSGAFPRGLTVTFFHRYCGKLEKEIINSEAVAILDGHDATFCPHFECAVANSIPVITAGQHWAKALPEGAHYSLKNPASAISVVHSIAALESIEGMKAGLICGLEKWRTKKPKGSDWIAAIMAAAATAPPAKIAAPSPLPKPTENPALNAAAQAQPVSDIMALVGAAPAGPLLHQLYPEMNTERCPRFMTPTAALAVSTFMGIPAAQMLDHMGFEALVIAEKIKGGHPLVLTNKTRRWADIQPGLRHAKNALAFGCAIDGATPAIVAKKKVNWSFTMPSEITETLNTPKAINSAYDASAGLYWVHDPVRGSLKCVLLTGGAGVLTINTSGASSFVLTDLASTKTVMGTDSCAFTIGDHGLGLFKIAALPTANNNSSDLMKMLAEDGLHLEWSAP